MQNLIYKPTKEEKKHYMNKIRKLVVVLRELGYDEEEVEEEAVKAVNKYLSMNRAETTVITFQDALEVHDEVRLMIRAE